MENDFCFICGKVTSKKEEINYCSNLCFNSDKALRTLVNNGPPPPLINDEDEDDDEPLCDVNHSDIGLVVTVTGIISRLECCLLKNNRRMEELSVSLSDLFVRTEAMVSQTQKSMLKHKTCKKCGIESRQKCSVCRQTYYCSSDCQLSDWKSHKLLCEPVCKPVV